MFHPPRAHVEPYSRLRRILAVSLRSALRIPVMHGLVEFDVTAARKAIAAHRDATGERLSFTAFIVGCVATAAAEYPEVHACRLGGRRLRIYEDVDVGVMVEREMEGRKQAIVAVVRAANRMDLLGVHRAIREAQEAPAEEAWTAFSTFNRIPLIVMRLFWPLYWWMICRSPELQRHFRGTISVTAIGMFADGGGWGIPVTNTTEVTIGGITVRPAFVDGVVQPREMLALTLSFDHTLIDGAAAARFTARLRQLIESAHGFPVAETPATT